MPLTTPLRLSSLLKAFWSVIIPGGLAPGTVTELLSQRAAVTGLWGLDLNGFVWTCMRWLNGDREGTGLSGGPGFAFLDREVQAKYERSESCFHLWLCCPERTERGQMLFTLQVSQRAQGERYFPAVPSHQQRAQWAQSWKTPMLWFCRYKYIKIYINRRWSCSLREHSTSVLWPYR